MKITKILNLMSENDGIIATLTIDGELSEDAAKDAISEGLGKLAHLAGSAFEAIRPASSKPLPNENGVLTLSQTKSFGDVSVTLAVSTVFEGVKPYMADMVIDEIFGPVVITTLYKGLGITPKEMTSEAKRIAGAPSNLKDILESMTYADLFGDRLSRGSMFPPGSAKGFGFGPEFEPSSSDQAFGRSGRSRGDGQAN